MGKLVVSLQEQIDTANGRAAMIGNQNDDLTEYVAEIEYRQCLSELGLTPEDLEGGTL